MDVHRGKLEGLMLLTPPRVFPDDRGFFVETFRESLWSGIGLPPFVQDNHSRSGLNVLRGIHLSLSGGGQGKLIRCGRGRIWDVAVDLRRSSPTFGQWEGFELDDVSHRQVYVPPGFGHGFCVLSDVVDVFYRLTTYYDPETELGVRWDDTAIGIEWPITNPILSKRDQTNPSLEELRPKL